jgi:hypothetical protein
MGFALKVPVPEIMYDHQQVSRVFQSIINQAVQLWYAASFGLEYSLLGSTQLNFSNRCLDPLVESKALIRFFSPGSTLESGLKTFRQRSLKW